VYVDRRLSDWRSIVVNSGSWLLNRWS